MVSGIQISFNDIVTRCNCGNKLTLTPNNGDIKLAVKVANKTEIEPTKIIAGETRWCASSTAKSIPLKPAPVAIAKPAQAPPVIEYLLHTECFFAKISTEPLPTAVPIKTDGPSLPSGTPIIKVVKEEIKTPTSVFNHLKLTIRLKIVIEDGM